MSNTESTLSHIGEVEHHPNWFIALGVVFLIGGAFAIFMPLVATLATTLAVGWALIFVGILQLVHSWGIRTWGGFILQAVIGAIIIIGGFAILFQPISAAVGLTLLLGAVFVAKGVMQVILGFRYRPHSNWGWLVASGIIAVILGLMIVLSWPWSTEWVLGTLAGISLIFSGWTYIMLAIAAKRVASA